MISLMFPFRDDGSRSEQFDWLQKRWAHYMPDVERIVCEDDGGTPFSKTIAVNNCYEKSSGDVLAMVDADVWVNPRIIRDAAKMIKSSSCGWVQPCNKVYRLNKSYTKNALKRDPEKNLLGISIHKDCERVTPVVGLIAVFSRKHFEAIGGMDPRFRGWGWEDTCFNLAMASQCGPPFKGRGVVYHFWHPRQRIGDKPVWEGQTERNATVGKQYKEAYRNKAKMGRIIEDVKGLTGI